MFASQALYQRRKIFKSLKNVWDFFFKYRHHLLYKAYFPFKCLHVFLKIDKINIFHKKFQGFPVCLLNSTSEIINVELRITFYSQIQASKTDTPTINSALT